jgi:DNA polymerase-3 subunit gamma/tau
MENFVVSARKYRPATFDTVVGQLSITSTLKNAIRNNQLAQAFLFCGPRGVGKTTCARILAKTINCENPSSNIEPCNTCTSCQTFNESSSFNIHELDAASNNSVDDIRNLVDQVRIPPQMGKYKVYIIDEVHMLSAQAFNAFLKTLEEPPAYAKFILATTEKHKIIPTILSRCQIFDFKRITIQDIANHLKYVAEKESVNADPEGLHLIAQKADGALRDALSIFDQMVNLGNHGISKELVLENLNVLDYDYYFRITDYMLAGNFKECLLILNEIILKGFEGQHFITGLGEHLRNLLMCIDASTIKLIEASESVKEKYLSQARNAPVVFLINALEINNKCDQSYRIANNKRLTLEIALIQMCQQGNAGFMAQSPVIPASQPITSATALPPASDKSKIQDGIEKPSPPPQPTHKAEPEPVIAVQFADEKPEPAPKAEAKPATPVTEPEIKATDHDAPRVSLPLMQSVKDILNQGANIAPKKEEGKDIEIRNEVFDEDKLKSAMLKFADSIQEDSSMLHTALITHPPVIKEGGTVVLTVDNPILQKELNAYWNKLMSFLSEELKNDKITLEVIINETPVESKRFMSDKDKLDAMKEKVPEINLLTDQLNLELDI